MGLFVMRKKVPKKYFTEGLTMMATAFGLVAGLAWNEAIKALIAEFIPRGAGVLSLFIYAGLVTVVAIFFSTRIIGLKRKIEEAEIQPEQE